MMNKLKLYTDGGSRGNPGPAGIGWVLFDKAELLIDFGSEYLSDNSTNNYAEYAALEIALKKVTRNRKHLKNIEIICHLDSELAVKQLTGEYKIKKDHLQELATKVKKQLDKFGSYELKHVKREKNKFADKLVNIALDIKSES
jgi:ribonuclease HI